MKKLQLKNIRRHWIDSLFFAHSYREYDTKHNENTRSRISSETFWISQPGTELSTSSLQSSDLAGLTGHGSMDLTALSAGQRALEFASSSGQDVTSNTMTSNVNDERTLWRYTQEFSGTVLRSQPTFLIFNSAMSTKNWRALRENMGSLIHYHCNWLRVRTRDKPSDATIPSPLITNSD
jgi:hypothetical protein